MTALQTGIILFLSVFTGWLISWLTTRLIFSSAIITRAGAKAGNLIQQEFQSSNIPEEKISNPLLFEKMKPVIEKHVDFFLNEKLATVFPLLYKFMGEKTLRQFKDAFMIEIDLLFPVIIKQYLFTLKKEIRLDKVISERINNIPVPIMRLQFFKYAKKEIFYFRLICCLAGFIMGIIMLAFLHFFQ